MTEETLDVVVDAVVKGVLDELHDRSLLEGIDEPILRELVDTLRTDAQRTARERFREVRVNDDETTSEVFVVVWHDRHTDDAITVHTTREGADARIESIMKSYDDECTNRGRDAHDWRERDYGRDSGWVRYVEGDHDDGPHGRIELRKVES